MSEPKSQGITYLRYAVNAQKKRPVAKYISMPIEKAEEILKQAEGFVPSQSGYDPRRNSERAAALILGLEVKDLVKKLNQQDVAKVLESLAEAKVKIKMLEIAGDKMHQHVTNRPASEAWIKARKGIE